MNPVVATLIDGRPHNAVSVHDRGLLYGDGLFETVRCEHGRLCWFDRHLARLEDGCQRLGIAIPDHAQLHAEAMALAGALPRAIVKIILTRGEALARRYGPVGGERSTRIVSVYEWPAMPQAEFRVGLSAVPLGCNPQLAGIKHLNRLEQVLAQQAAAATGLDEVLMLSSADEVVCGSASNLFVLNEAELWTPPVTQCGVAGVMRSLVIEAAPRLGLTVHIAPLTTALLAAARTMFVTNVRLGVQVVDWYEGRRLQLDARCTQLQELINGTI